MKAEYSKHKSFKIDQKWVLLLSHQEIIRSYSSATIDPSNLLTAYRAVIKPWFTGSIDHKNRNKLVILWVDCACIYNRQLHPMITSRAHQALIYSPDLLVSQFIDVRCDSCKDLRQAMQNVWLKTGCKLYKVVCIQDSLTINLDRDNKYFTIFVSKTRFVRLF